MKIVASLFLGVCLCSTGALAEDVGAEDSLISVSQGGDGDLGLDSDPTAEFDSHMNNKRLTRSEEEALAEYLVNAGLATPTEAYDIVNPTAAVIGSAGVGIVAMAAESGTNLNVSGRWVYTEERTGCSDTGGSRYTCDELGLDKPLVDARVWLYHHPFDGSPYQVGQGFTDGLGRYSFAVAIPEPFSRDRFSVEVELRSVVWRNPLFTIYPHVPPEGKQAKHVASSTVGPFKVRTGDEQIGTYGLSGRAVNAYATAGMVYEEWFSSDVVRDEFFNLDIFVGDVDDRCESLKANGVFTFTLDRPEIFPHINISCPLDSACAGICARQPGHILAHEIGHYIFWLAAAGHVKESMYDYPFTGINGVPDGATSSLTPEWESVTFSEGFASFVAAATFYAPSAKTVAVDTTVVASQGQFYCPGENTSDRTYAGEPQTHRLSATVSQFLWELYDDEEFSLVWGGEALSLEPNWFTGAIRYAPLGDGNHELLENNLPFPSGADSDLDGPNVFDFVIWAGSPFQSELGDVYGQCLKGTNEE